MRQSLIILMLIALILSSIVFGIFINELADKPCLSCPTCAKINYSSLNTSSCPFEMKPSDADFDTVGIYQTPKYFCVWVQDRDEDEIARTTFHEIAHYYSDIKYEHYCEE